MTSRTVERPVQSNAGPTSSKAGLWRVLAAVEVGMATAAVLLEPAHSGCDGRRDQFGWRLRYSD
jgi:hypothetical protein